MIGPSAVAAFGYCALLAIVTSVQAALKSLQRQSLRSDGSIARI